MASNVLVVDDDPNLVRLMSKFLKLEGFAPVLAGIPIVVMSGVAADSSIDLEAAASFSKPVSFLEVVDVVRQLCDARASAQPRV